LPVIIAIMVAGGAWYQLVLRERGAATPPDSWRQRKKRGRYVA